jgi:hypothetical protein
MATQTETLNLRGNGLLGYLFSPHIRLYRPVLPGIYMRGMIPVIKYFYGLPEKEKGSKKRNQESIGTLSVHCVMAM